MIDSEALKLAAQATSTAVALVALYLTFRGERRNQIRFKEQLDLSRRIGEANIRPLLAVTVSGYVDRKALELENHGAGTAVVRELAFRRGKHTATDVLDLMEFEQEIEWDDFITGLENSTLYIRPNSSEMMIELTQDHLLEQGFSEDEAATVLKELEKQIDEVRVTVTYDDVLGNVVAKKEQLN
ncbi:MAG: hypothetical protein ACREBG_01025 [Pyrinomonadaceae bacterium]